MPIITILGTQLNFPNSGTDPNWAPNIIQFAQLVEQALNAGFVGAFDVAPQSLDISAYNPGTNININPLFFPVTEVTGAAIRYTVTRTTSLENVSEEGNLQIVYNSTNPVGNKWEISNERLGDASITFTITDTGQIQFTTSTLSGTNHTGFIFFTAQSLLVT